MSSKREAYEKAITNLKAWAALVGAPEDATCEQVRELFAAIRALVAELDEEIRQLKMSPEYIGIRVSDHTAVVRERDDLQAKLAEVDAALLDTLREVEQLERERADKVRMLGEALTENSALRLQLAEVERERDTARMLWQAATDANRLLADDLNKLRARIEGSQRIALFSDGTYKRLWSEIDIERFEMAVQFHAVPVSSAEEPTLFGMKVAAHEAAPEGAVTFTDQAATEVLGVITSAEEKPDE